MRNLFILFYFTLISIIQRSNPQQYQVLCGVFYAIKCFTFGLYTFLFFFYSIEWETRQNATCACEIIQYVIPIANWLCASCVQVYCKIHDIRMPLIRRAREFALQLIAATNMLCHWYFSKKIFWTRWQIDSYPLAIVAISTRVRREAREGE